MIDVKQAVQIARQGALELLSQAASTLEEIEGIPTKAVTSGALRSACGEM